MLLFNIPNDKQTSTCQYRARLHQISETRTAQLQSTVRLWPSSLIKIKMNYINDTEHCDEERW